MDTRQNSGGDLLQKPLEVQLSIREHIVECLIHRKNKSPLQKTQNPSIFKVLPVFEKIYEPYCISS